MPKTAKKTVDTAAADKAIADAARNLFAAIAMHAPALASTVSSVAPVEDEDADDVSDEDEAEDDEDEEKELPTLDREETEALGIKDLRALAKEYGISETKKADILAAFDEGNFFDEGEDEADEEDEDEDEDSDEEESEGYSREELEEEDLKSLRAIAKEAGFSASDYKGMDQDALIDLILGEDDEDEDEDDEDESDEDEADEDEEEVEELDEDALNAMSLTELKSLAKEIGVKVKVPASAKTDAKKKKVYVEAILETGDEE